MHTNTYYPRMEVAIQGDKSYKTINHSCQEIRELVFNHISLKIIKKLLLIFVGITTGIYKQYWYLQLSILRKYGLKKIICGIYAASGDPASDEDLHCLSKELKKGTKIPSNTSKTESGSSSER